MYEGDSDPLPIEIRGHAGRLDQRELHKKRPDCWDTGMTAAERPITISTFWIESLKLIWKKDRCTCTAQSLKIADTNGAASISLIRGKSPRMAADECRHVDTIDD